MGQAKIDGTEVLAMLGVAVGYQLVNRALQIRTELQVGSILLCVHGKL